MWVTYEGNYRAVFHMLPTLNMEDIKDGFVVVYKLRPGESKITLQSCYYKNNKQSSPWDMQTNEEAQAILKGVPLDIENLPLKTYPPYVERPPSPPCTMTPLSEMHLYDSSDDE